MRLRVCCRLGRDGVFFRSGQLCLELLRDRLRDHRSRWQKYPSSSGRKCPPRDERRLAFDQLHVHSHLIAGALHAAGQNVRYAEFASDLG